MFSVLKKVFGGIVAIFVVIFIIGACFGESDEGSSDYTTWWKKICPKCVFIEKKELKTPNPICEVGEGVSIKVSPMTLRIYQVKDEYEPQSKWGFAYASDLTVTAFLPDGMDKVLVKGSYDSETSFADARAFNSMEDKNKELQKWALRLNSLFNYDPIPSLFLMEKKSFEYIYSMKNKEVARVVKPMFAVNDLKRVVFKVRDTKCVFDFE